MNHLSFPLQSDSSAGEQLCYGEGGEMMRMKEGLRNSEGGGGGEGGATAVKGNEK